MTWEKWGWATAGAAAGGALVYLMKNKSLVSASSRSFFGVPKAEIKALLQKPNACVTLLSADYCPFAARAWIALLEKGVPFEHLPCSYFMGEKDPGTKVLYGLGLSTVPAMIHNGQVFTESMELARYIDDVFPSPPLKPVDPAMLFNMNLFLSRHSSMCGFFYTFLRNQDPAKHDEIAKKFNEMLQKFNDDLATFAGPFLCGEQFTLADIQLIGVIERAMVVLPHYKTPWCIPAEQTNIFKWYEAVKARDSVKATMANRSELSLKSYCYEAKERNEYLIEVYQCYANDEVKVAKEKNIESGSVGYNAYKHFKLAH